VSQYLENLKAWKQGFGRFAEIQDWKPGWGPTSWKWKALYATDYLATPLFLAGPVVSISRFVAEYWGVQGAHFIHAGPILWGTTRCQPWVRLAVPAAWLILLGALVKLIRLALA